MQQSVKTQPPEEKRIDVAEDFIYNSRNPGYNGQYRSWRKTTDSPYLFRFAQDPREHAYMDGTGFASTTASATEQRTLRQVSEVIGFALLLLMLVQLGGGSLIVWGLQMLGLDIRLDFLTLSMKGSQWLVIAVRVLVMLLQYGGALLIANRFFRIPTKIRIPFTYRAFPEGIGAVGCAMLCAAVFCVLDHLGGHGAESAQQLFSYKNATALMAYGIFDMLIVSLLHELLMRGTLLPMLRQFGDGFAICSVAAMGFLFPNTTSWRVGMFLIGLASGYFLLKGGSFLNCALMHTIYHALIYARLILVYHDGAVATPLQYILILSAMGVLAVASYCLTRYGRLRLDNRKTHLPLSKKIMTLCESFTMLPWLAFSLLLAVAQLFL